MKLIRRKKFSQRTAKPLNIVFWPNISSGTREPQLIFFTETEYFTLIFESEVEIKELLSQAHKVQHQFAELNS